MGLKINFYYLFSQKKSLIEIDSIFRINNILFNKYGDGEYSYWIDGPIWKYGDAKNKKYCKKEDRVCSQDLIHSAINYYSPILKYDVASHGKSYPVILSAIEQECDDSIEIGVSIDEDFLTDQMVDREQRTLFLKSLFLSIAKLQDCYWGIAGLELAGFNGTVPIGWDQLTANDFYDLCFISNQAMSNITLNMESLKEGFSITTGPNQSVFIQRGGELFAIDRSIN